MGAWICLNWMGLGIADCTMGVAIDLSSLVAVARVVASPYLQKPLLFEVLDRERKSARWDLVLVLNFDALCVCLLLVLLTSPHLTILNDGLIPDSMFPLRKPSNESVPR